MVPGVEQFYPLGINGNIGSRNIRDVADNSSEVAEMPVAEAVTLPRAGLHADQSWSHYLNKCESQHASRPRIFGLPLVPRRSNVLSRVGVAVSGYVA